MERHRDNLIEQLGALAPAQGALDQILWHFGTDVLAKVARLYGGDMVANGRGDIVFLSNLFDYQGVPLLANYATSKAYIPTLADQTVWVPDPQRPALKSARPNC